MVRAGVHRAGRARRQPRAPPRGRVGRARRRDRARGRRRAAGRPLRRDRRDRRAASAGVAGIVLDGAIRDRAEIAELGLPVFYRGTSPRGPGKKRARRARRPGRARRGHDRSGRPRVRRRRRRRGRRRRRRRRRRRPPPTRSRPREQAIVAAIRARRDDRRHLRPEGAPVKITAHRGDAARDPARTGVPLGRRRAGRARTSSSSPSTPTRASPATASRSARTSAPSSPTGELMARQFVGRSPGDVEAILRSIWTEGRWKMFPQFTQLLVAGIEVACWDALGRALGVPTRTFFGGQVQDGARLLRLPPGRRARDGSRRTPASWRARATAVIYLKVGRGSARRRRLRRRGSRGDRARAAAADRPERGLGPRDCRRPDPPARAVRPRLGRAADARRATSTGSRTSAAR